MVNFAQSFVFLAKSYPPARYSTARTIDWLALMDILDSSCGDVT
ncbi:hypothetical protein KP509_04G027700 [Ceratopteris richardii]|uniref:Uncharacterized protein n=1 Tax=Ceratopteris richardii TaxID=49495 RepID=A0A8T2URD1_CERRI|nr:hypothetical protein KP509_04G027700 [Ceratopteris richardii]